MEAFVRKLEESNRGEHEFLQAVDEVLQTVRPVLERNPAYRRLGVLERITEAERIIIFRVPWQDDMGQVHVNRGFRVEMSSALGPYKGGLRFHPSVNLSIMKFLAFEQVFKNALTTLAMGGAKGGADFNPKGCSDEEVMRFCQSFMAELYRHIGANTDVPAGDIGVGAREIGFLFGMYKRLANEFTGVLTGKSLNWGGSLIRPEATGYGVVYFAAEMLAVANATLEGKVCLISGSGNVAQYTAEKLIAHGAKVVTLSDSSGFIHDPAGIDAAKLCFVKALKNMRRGRIEEYAAHYPEAVYTPRERTAQANPLWGIKAECAFPCATENEIGTRDAEALVRNGIRLVCEGANMPCTPEAIDLFQGSGVLYAPGKAANAGGVAVSGLEMAQNSMRLNWPRQEVEERLQHIMQCIHRTCLDAAAEYGRPGNYLVGANIAGFTKVVESMLDQGLV